MSEKNLFKILFAFFLFISSLSGCISAANHQRELHSTQEREMTVGIDYLPHFIEYLN